MNTWLLIQHAALCKCAAVAQCCVVAKKKKMKRGAKSLAGGGMGRKKKTDSSQFGSMEAFVSRGKGNSLGSSLTQCSRRLNEFDLSVHAGTNDKTKFMIREIKFRNTV